MDGREHGRGRQTRKQLTDRVNALKGYRDQFQKVFGGDATPENMMQAISAYERTIITGDTPWDKWKAGDESAMQGAIGAAGKSFRMPNALTVTTALCSPISSITMSASAWISRSRMSAGSRLQISRKIRAHSRRRRLRDVAKSAPYFHDGSIATLEEAVDFMLGGGRPNPYLDKKNLEKRTMTKEQRDDLLAFLRSLSVNNCQITAPPLPQN